MPFDSMPEPLGTPHWKGARCHDMCERPFLAGRQSRRVSTDIDTHGSRLPPRVDFWGHFWDIQFS